ncbi:hypothetical protein EX30DRAFT_351587 [Ascodesmis nigricans]|uniref:RING-type domain-containing protein n=1 Tax=Ascodesmis nigricans TaxID=341454 RepID=A0A4S2MRP2_9PEZI|nr:hypothetical protein EX30DRAFT_351587 [Ascodesmis nigricans]
MTSTANNRKGTSITHLINWEAAAPRMSSYQDFRPRNTRRNPTYGMGSGYHAADKARYINANYRFIVNPQGDYRAQAVDSDVHLPWEKVLQVVASGRTQCPNCPICLSTPVAPRMSKCGHIFCLTCLVRYMESGAEERPVDRRPRYKKCVICTDSVYMKDIKPVRFFIGQEKEPPKAGDVVELNLLMRKAGTTLALPMEDADHLSEIDAIPWYFAAEVMDYARIMKGSEEYMKSEFEREIEDLKISEQEDKENGLLFGDSGEWVRKAVRLIRTEMEGFEGLGNPDPALEHALTTKEKAKEPKTPKAPIQFNDSEAPDMYHIHHEARSGHSSTLQTLAPSSELPSASTRPNPPPEPRGAPYYFYQALPHYYLSPLDIRILKVAFGSFSLFPTTVLPQVENVSTGHSVDDDLRRRAKYLAHLPYGCEVGFLECDWTGIIAPETLEKFAPELSKRRKAKKEKELKEERDKVRAEKMEEEERWAAIRSRRYEPVPTEDRFSADDFVPLAPHFDRSDVAGSPGASTHIDTALNNLSLNPRPQNRNTTTVWGTPALPPVSDAFLYDTHPHHEDNSGWRMDWEQELLEDDMMAQLEMEGAFDDDFEGRGGRGGGAVKHTPGKAPSHGKGQRKGKGKKKVVTLMTNGGKRGA